MCNRHECPHPHPHPHPPCFLSPGLSSSPSVSVSPDLVSIRCDGALKVEDQPVVALVKNKRKTEKKPFLPTENSYCLRTLWKPDGNNFYYLTFFRFVCLFFFFLRLEKDADCACFPGGQYRDTQTLLGTRPFVS